MSQEGSTQGYNAYQDEEGEDVSMDQVERPTGNTNGAGTGNATASTSTVPQPQAVTSRPQAAEASGSGSGKVVHGPGPKPDIVSRNRLKAKYAELQKQYHVVFEEHERKRKELESKEAKCALLQNEIDLILDQIYAADYASGAKRLPPTLLYDSDDEQSGSPSAPKKEKGTEDVKMEEEEGTSKLRIHDLLER
ncbi:hypothetical protein BT69DRAFT_376726 [Atractiella rhizophila]|nr:hypothetical protein BT69DRAFT_376726 [Atractiella rhizophila]